MKIFKDKSDKTPIMTIIVLTSIIICLIVFGLLYSPNPTIKITDEIIDEPTGIKEEPKRDLLISNNDSIKKLIKVG